MSNMPILYSFRRCPYAMRARLAIRSAGVQVELREVKLANKPAQLIAASPKASVPVMILPDGRVVDESLDIMYWVLQDHGMLKNTVSPDDVRALITRNDTEFKHTLDRYKYFERYPEQTRADYQEQGLCFLTTLEQRLTQNTYLFGEAQSVADLAIFPFVRQFAHVDQTWFYQTNLTHLQNWLQNHLEGELFLSVMGKYVPWCEGDEVVIF